MDTDLIPELRPILAASASNVVILVGAGVSMGALLGTPIMHSMDGGSEAPAYWATARIEPRTT